MPRQPSKRSRAFTLLEVMVALAIVAIALLAALRVAGQAASGATDMRMRMLAGWVAGNRLAEHRARRDFPPPGIAEGVAVQAGIAFQWREEVTPMQSPAFRRVDVMVFAPSGEEPALARLSGFVTRAELR